MFKPTVRTACKSEVTKIGLVLSLHAHGYLYIRLPKPNCHFITTLNVENIRHDRLLWVNILNNYSVVFQARMLTTGCLQSVGHITFDLSLYLKITQ